MNLKDSSRLDALLDPNCLDGHRCDRFFNYGQGRQAANYGIAPQFNAEKISVSYSSGEIEYIQHPRWAKSRIEYWKTYNRAKKTDWCDWIFEHPLFNSWRDEDNSHFLWLNGDAGQGKTMLSACIIDNLISSEDYANKTIAVAYYFCDRKTYEDENAIDVLRGLIRLLVDYDPRLDMSACNRAVTRTLGRSTSITLAYQLSEQMQMMLSNTQLRTVYFVIDAYDEYEDKDHPVWEEVLDSMARMTVENTKLKWLVTTRRTCHCMRERFNGRASDNFVEINLSHQNLKTDIHQLIDKQLSQFEWLANKGILRQELRSLIFEKSRLRFFWVFYICEELRKQKVDGAHAVQFVKDAPADLPTLQRYSDAGVSAHDQRDKVNELIKEGYRLYRLFKECIHTTALSPANTQEKDARYDLLADSAAKHKEAIRIASNTYPIQHGGIVRANIGAAESYRELSCGLDSPTNPLDFIEDAESHIRDAITMASKIKDSGLEQRAYFEAILIDAQKIIVKESLKDSKGAFTGEVGALTTLLEQAKAVGEQLEASKQQYIDDMKVLTYIKEWLNKLNKTIDKLKSSTAA